MAEGTPMNLPGERSGTGEASCCPMPSTRTLPGRMPSGSGRWGRRNAQKALHKAAKDPYEPEYGSASRGPRLP